MTNQITKTLLAVSTYRKNEALRVLLNSLVDNGYTKDNEVVITDDAFPNAKEVYDEFLPKIPSLSYMGGSRGGIWYNKNRCLYWFLEKTKCSHLIMLDDDIVFTKAGMIEALQESTRVDGSKHIMGYLGGYRDPLTKTGFFSTFPVIASTDKLVWTNGTQGVLLYFTRDIVEAAGYYQKMPYFYGYEHSLYSRIVNKLQRVAPNFFCFFKKCPKFFVTQMIPNSYERQKGEETLTEGEWDVKFREDIDKKQSPFYWEMASKVEAGLLLSNPIHNLKLKEETIYTKDKEDLTNSK